MTGELNLLTQALVRFNPGLPLAIAFSGGADSTALLLACNDKWPGQICALHVHHGLQAAADRFEQHCRVVCATLGLPLEVRRVSVRVGPGQSQEQVARNARYGALVEHFSAATPALQPWSAVRDIAISHHADDQVETLLLALSRGAGMPGLAAMPARWRVGKLTFHRPLLEVPQSDVRDWLVQRGIGWIEDPSNTDERFTRNRIRARLLPALNAALPQFRSTFARSAAHAAQATELAAEIGAEDLARIGNPPLLAALQTLSPARRSNVLRYWLRTQHQTTPQTAQLRELCSQIDACTTRAHRLRIKVGTGLVERRQEHLDWYNPALLKG